MENKTNKTVWIIAIAILLITAWFGYKYFQKRKQYQIAPLPFDDPAVTPKKVIALQPLTVTPLEKVAPPPPPPAPKPLSATDKMIQARAEQHAGYIYKGLVLNNYAPFSDNKVQWAEVRAKLMIEDGCQPIDVKNAYIRKYGYSFADDFKRFATSAMIKAWNDRIAKGRV
jgi:hypothetical protein